MPAMILRVRTASERTLRAEGDPIANGWSGSRPIHQAQDFSRKLECLVADERLGFWQNGRLACASPLIITIVIIIYLLPAPSAELFPYPYWCRTGAVLIQPRQR